jgi:hypothetical protein
LFLSTSTNFLDILPSFCTAVKEFLKVHDSLLSRTWADRNDLARSRCTALRAVGDCCNILQLMYNQAPAVHLALAVSDD